MQNFIEIELAFDDPSGLGFASVRADHVSLIQHSSSGGCILGLTSGEIVESSESKEQVLSKVDLVLAKHTPTDILRRSG